MKEEKRFLGLDFDSDPHIIGTNAGSFEGAYADAYSIVLFDTDQKRSGIPQSIKSNVHVDSPLIPGRSATIGTFEDKETKRLIVFKWNELGNHHILSYDPKRGTNGEVDLIAESSTFDFKEDKLITGVSLVGPLLSWCDYHNLDRAINIERANNYNKKSEINLYFPRSTVAVDSRLFTVQILNSGNPVLTLTGFYTASTSDVQDFNLMIQGWANAFNASAGSQYFTADPCGKFVELVATQAGEWSIVASLQDTIATVVQSAVMMWSWYENRYNDPWNDFQTVQARYPFPCDPTVSFGTDTSRLINYLERRTFQLAIRLRRKDNENTCVSPHSNIPIDASSVCAAAGAGSNNYIDINFTHPYFSTLSMVSEIRSVDILVSVDEGPWSLVETLYPEDYVYGQTYRFYNDTNYPPIPTSEAILLSNAAPLLSKSKVIVGDNNSNSRELTAGIKEGYDTPCVDMSLSVTYDSSTMAGSRLVTIRIPVRYRATLQLWPGANNQPICNYGKGEGPVIGGITQNFHSEDVGSSAKQKIPLKGPLIYAAGTDHYGIGKQTASLVLPCGTLQPTLSSDGNGVIDASFTGFSLNDCNKAGRSAARQLMENDAFKIWVEIQVPEGDTYVFRAASHQCWDDVDSAGVGNGYNINNDREYQKTSTRMLSVGGIDGETEWVVTVPVGSPTITGPEFEMADLSLAQALADENVACIIEGNLVDNFGLNTDIKERAIPMELQYLKWLLSAGIPITHTCRSDHNGYFFFANAAVVAVDSRVGVLGCTGNPLIPNGAIPAMTAGAFFPTDLTIIKEPGSNLFFDGDFNAAAALSPSGSADFHTVGESRYYTIYNHDPAISEKLSTFIEGLILTSITFQPIPDANIVFTKTGRYAQTGVDGRFSLRVWADMAPNNDFTLNNNDRTGTVYLYSNSLCPYEFFYNSSAFTISPFQPNQNYSLSHPYNLGTISGAIQVVPIIQSAFGHGTICQFGIVYKDESGRMTAVSTDLDRLILDIPNITDIGGNEGVPTVTININQAVPIPVIGRFTHYQIVRTEAKVPFQITIPVNEVQYVLRWDEATTSPVTTTFAANNAKEIYLNWQDTILRYKEQNSDSMLAYDFEEGDRLILLKNSDGVTYTQYFDFPIKTDQAGNLVIDNRLSLPELKAGTLIKIYRPVKDQTELPWFEIPGMCFEINDPYGANPTHSVTSAIVPYGDVYYRKRAMQLTNGVTYTYRIESLSISDFYSSEVQQLGRVTFEDENAAQVSLPTSIRFSNPYLPGTITNGLTMFEPLNRKQMNISYGLIQKMVYVGDVLLVFFNNSITVAIYVNKDHLATGDGGVLVSLTETLLPPPRPFYREWGTQNPESIVVREGWVWGLDVERQVYWGYSVNGFDSKTEYGVNTKVHDLSTLLYSADRTLCPAGYDPKYDLIYLTLIRIKDGQTFLMETLSFHEKTNHWNSRMPFLPEFYGTVGENILSFTQGEFWQHNTGRDYNVFYGIESKSSLTPVFNISPSDEKFWLAIELKTNWELVSPEIENEKGQTSDLSDPGDWEVSEGARKASFLRDTTTPVDNPILNGDVLRSETLTVVLEWDSREYVYLFSVTAFYELSERTNK